MLAQSNDVDAANYLALRVNCSHQTRQPVQQPKSPAIQTHNKCINNNSLVRLSLFCETIVHTNKTLGAHQQAGRATGLNG